MSRIGNWKNVLLIVCLLLSGCGWRHGDDRPVIQFTRIPPASEGGPDKVDMIEGKVIGSRRGQRIVLFSKASGVWWVQPLDVEPFTKIEQDSSWKSATHLGIEYAALLVDSTYLPPSTIPALPKPGGQVLAVASVSGGQVTPTINQTLKFSGYEWTIRHVARERFGSMLYYDPANAWTDSHGFLHLRITRKSESWMCGSVALSRSLGYGNYVFSVQDVSHLEPATELSFLTFDEQNGEQHHREMDIELSRWGDPKNKSGDYVVQPSWFPENKVKFQPPAGPLNTSIHWEAGAATFETAPAGNGTSQHRTVFAKTFSAGIPTPGNELINIDFCEFEHAKVPLQNGAEVVIEQFQYLP
jgi:hypothetical protein